MLSGQALYDQLSSMNLGAMSDDQFRAMGFPRGRQDALDALSSLRNQYDPQTIANRAQQAQIQANQPAIATLQSQGTTLADQYQQLLQTVKGQGKAAFDTATSGENAFLGARGLLSQEGRGNNELSQAQNTVNTSNAANEQNVTSGNIATQLQIAQQIAGLQAGNLPQAENFAQNLVNTRAGITNTNTEQQVALQSAQLAAAKPFGVGNLVFNPSNSTFTQPRTGGGGNTMDAISMARTMLAKKQTKASRPTMADMSQFVKPA